VENPLDSEVYKKQPVNYEEIDKILDSTNGIYIMPAARK
jgi:hypothetical protein